MKNIFTDWYGKRVVLFVTIPSHVHYVGTLEKAEGSLVKLTHVTPLRETRKLPDLIVNITCSQYSRLELVMDSKDDPSQGK